MKRILIAILALSLLYFGAAGAEKTVPRTLEEIRAGGVLRVGTAGD